MKNKNPNFQIDYINELSKIKCILDFFVKSFEIYENFEEGNVYYWSQNVFNDRYDSLKEIYNKFLEENYDITFLPKDEDPLFDTPQQSLLGYAFYKLEPLAYLIAIKNESFLFP